MFWGIRKQYNITMKIFWWAASCCSYLKSYISSQAKQNGYADLGSLVSEPLRSPRTEASESQGITSPRSHLDLTKIKRHHQTNHSSPQSPLSPRRPSYEDLREQGKIAFERGKSKAERNTEGKAQGEMSQTAPAGSSTVNSGPDIVRREIKGKSCTKFKLGFFLRKIQVFWIKRLQLANAPNL